MSVTDPGERDRMSGAARLAGERAPLVQQAAAADVAVIGAGLGGSLLALALSRQGRSVVVIDPQPSFPEDFRCEKLSGEQVELLRRLGLDEALAQGLAAHGLAVQAPRDLSARGFRYDQLVNAARAAWPEQVRLMVDRVVRLDPDARRPRAHLASGGEVDARVAVLATGAAGRLRRELALERRILRERQSICIGFTVRRRTGEAFPFEGLVRHGERPGDKVAFASLFPWPDAHPGAMRVNLFTYHDAREAQVRALRQDPLGETLALLPGLEPMLADAEVVEGPEIRSTDLYAADGAAKPGIVLIGDAQASSCPATGMGVTRLLTDIARLTEIHLPAWLEAGEADARGVSAFADDPVRRRLAKTALQRAERGRRLASDTRWAWRLRRHVASARRALGAPRPEAVAPTGAAASPAASPSDWVRGDWVRVRSAAEILATLDAKGRVDGLPFMPEMAALCGQPMQVHRRADRTCVEGFGLRRLDNTLLLERARCDGSAHDGCQRNCLMFWKTAWLEPLEPAVDAPAARAQDPEVQKLKMQDLEALARLQALPTRGDGRYLCQSTLLAAATQAAPRRDTPQLARELRRGELAPGRFAQILARAVVNRLRRLVGLRDLGVLKGLSEKPSRGALDLRPGERVRIRTGTALRKALTPDCRNAGLTFEPEMTLRAGELHEVAYPVEKMIHEETGQMVRLKRTVVLKDVDCRGICARNCPRANPLFWRESWLERVEDETGL